MSQKEIHGSQPGKKYKDFRIKLEDLVKLNKSSVEDAPIYKYEDNGDNDIIVEVVEVKHEHVPQELINKAINFKSHVDDYRYRSCNNLIMESLTSSNVINFVLNLSKY